MKILKIIFLYYIVFNLNIFTLGCFFDEAITYTHPEQNAQDNSTTVDNSITVESKYLSDIIDIFVGYQNSCAIMKNEETYCWGTNGHGQLTLFNERLSYFPTKIYHLLEPIKKISIGEHNICALHKDKSISCWGNNTSGQLGLNSLFNYQFPQKNIRIDNITDISTNYNHSCAVTESGNVYCWGDNTDRKLGFYGSSTVLVPTLVPDISNAIQISTGGEHTCALINDGGIFCWGDNTYGQTGNGQTLQGQINPTKVINISNAIQVAAGWGHTCALTSDKLVYCWGDNYHGQLGTGVLPSSSCTGFGDRGSNGTPQQVIGINNAIQISVKKGQYSCALLDNGSVNCWGWNMSGQLGIYSNGSFCARSSSPVFVDNVSDATSVKVGDSHTCALLSDGTGKCWGTGALGDNDSYSRIYSPQLILNKIN